MSIEKRKNMNKFFKNGNECVPLVVVVARIKRQLGRDKQKMYNRDNRAINKISYRLNKSQSKSGG